MKSLGLIALMCVATALAAQGPVYAAETKATTAHATKKPVATARKAPSKTAKPAPKATPQGDEETSAPTMSPEEGDDASATTIAESAEPVLPGSKIFPWYGSLKKTEVNVRSGPGNKYPVLWIYQRAGYPVQVLTRYDNYYKIRDVEGEEGWVYIGMVSKRVTALVGGSQPANLHKKPDPASPVVARLAPDLVVEMDEECETLGNQTFCKVNAMGTKGWVDKSALQMVE